MKKIKIDKECIESVESFFCKCLDCGYVFSVNCDTTQVIKYCPVCGILFNEKEIKE